MTTKIFSCSFAGLDCCLVEVECDISQGLPSFSIVGLGDTSVQESKERVRSSIKNIGASFPSMKKVINLAPAEVRKQGSLFDLPIALSILIASKQIRGDFLKDSLVVGELALDGEVKRAAGILPIVQYAKEQGMKSIFLPHANTKEASFINGVNIYGVMNLRQLVAVDSNILSLSELKAKEELRFHRGIMGEIPPLIGLEKEKRALTIAAAGGHNLLLHGAPGCGKTVISRAFKYFLPAMDKEQMLESTKIFSVAGLLTESDPYIQIRPFRELHHTATKTSLIGGGVPIRPGEISLAHNGVLFMDEIAEFPQKVLETLRQPLEDKCIKVSRSRRSVELPANFILIATMNPCPCGYYGEQYKKCKCTDYQVKLYQKRISGPLIDRFDMIVKVENTKMAQIFTDKFNNRSFHIHKQIGNALKMQKDRFSSEKIHKNSDMNMSLIKSTCSLSSQAKELLNQASERLGCSNRVYLKLIKLARTIADLDNNDLIEGRHIAEAIQYRQLLPSP